MTMTERTLNRTTMQRQLLLERAPLSVSEAVQKVVALQAQNAASPYVALWNRVTGFEAAEMDAAFASHQVVKATLMRNTLHAVQGDDYRPFREAMEPMLRASRLYDNRFRGSGLTTDDVHALLPDLLTFAEEPRTGPEIESWVLERHGLQPDPEGWQMLRGYLPLLHAPGGPPWTYGQRARWLAARDVPVLTDDTAAPPALEQLIRRFLGGFGPATVPDVANFLLAPRTRIKNALASMDDLVHLDGPGKLPYYDLPGLPLVDAEVPAPPRLMAMWDSVLMANHDRSRILPPAYRKAVVRTNGDVLPTVLVDGYVAGVWRTVDGGVEALAFQPLPAAVWEGLAVEAQSLATMLAGRDAGVYRRYDHWWNRLPEAEVRLLATS